MLDLSNINIGRPQTQISQMTGTDSLMKQLHQKLSVEPIGTHYNPSNVVRPEFTAAGGYVPTVRRYTIIEPYKIAVPYPPDATGPVVGRDTFLEGDISEADLIAARANIAYLLQAGIIIENGYMRI